MCANLSVWNGGHEMEGVQSISLYYTGNVNPANVEARDLIQILSAFTRITTKANQTYHGSGVKSSVRIERIEPGSIDLQWVHEVLASAQSVFRRCPACSSALRMPHP